MTTIKKTLTADVSVTQTGGSAKIGSSLANAGSGSWTGDSTTIPGPTPEPKPTPTDPFPRHEPDDRMSYPVTTKTVIGTDGNDRQYGTAASERFEGKGGDDMIWGGAGNDLIFTGEGRDAVTFASKMIAANADTVVDFNVANDWIRLNNNVFTKLWEGKLGSSVFRAGTKALDHNDHILYDRSSGKLFYDADGSGSGAAVHFATFENKANLTAADFYVL
jgi:Ca2+-binding RTX toxin-like protein